MVYSTLFVTKSEALVSDFKPSFFSHGFDVHVEDNNPASFIKKQWDVILIDDDIGASLDLAVCLCDSFPDTYIAIIGGQDESGRSIIWPRDISGDLLDTLVRTVAFNLGKIKKAAESPLEQLSPNLNQVSLDLFEQITEKDKLIQIAYQGMGALIKDHQLSSNRAADLIASHTHITSELVLLLHQIIILSVKIPPELTDLIVELSAYLSGQMGLSESDQKDLSDAAHLLYFGWVGHAAQNSTEVLADPPPQIIHWAESRLKKFHLLNRITDIIVNSFEKWDGSGFPMQKTNDEIPLLSRILHLSNTYSQMALSKGLLKDEIVSIISQRAGKDYDPQLVQLFIDYVNLKGDTKIHASRVVLFENLKPGMIPSIGIHSISGTHLVSAGVEISQQILSQLTQYHRKDPITETVLIKE